MRRMIVFMLGLLLFMATLEADEPPGNAPAEKPTTAAAEYQALSREYRARQQAFSQTYRNAKTPEERQQVLKDMDPQPQKFAARFLELAERHPDDPVAVDALIWLLTNTDHASIRSGDEARRALSILAEEYVEHEKIGPLCSWLVVDSSPVKEQLLRAVLARNPHRAAQAQACFALGTTLQRQAKLAQMLRNDPSHWQRVVQSSGEEYARHVAALDIEKRLQEAEQLFEQVLEKYGDVPSSRGTLGDRAKGELFELRHLAIGNPAPEIEGEDIDGQHFKLSDYRGKVVALIFSGHWCSPCRAMYPHERSLVSRLAGQPFALLGVNSDRDRDELKKTLEEEGNTWRCWWDGGSTSGPIATAWSVSSWPTIYVLDQKGVIRFKDVRGEALDNAVESLLEKQAAPANETGKDSK